jgi:hypothetical protein
MRPPRIPLHAFPDVLLHADELAVKRHPQYAAAKAGDSDAAKILVDSLAKRGRVNELSSLLQGRQVVLLPVHALESEGVNEIPIALAERLSEWLSLPITESIVQSNTVGHTGASGFQRLANQALFEGRWNSIGIIFSSMTLSVREGRSRTSSGTSRQQEVTPLAQPS